MEPSSQKDPQFINPSPLFKREKKRVKPLIFQLKYALYSELSTFIYPELTDREAAYHIKIHDLFWLSFVLSASNKRHKG